MALKVLLADDSVPAQNMGKKILVDAGYEVVAVSNGLEALKKIADSVPDIAILDIFMPGYTGLEVCSRLRGNAVTAELPVILTVGKLEPYKPEDGEKVHSNAVIVKPFASEELVSAVRSLVGLPFAIRPEVPAAKAPAQPEPASNPVPEDDYEEEAPMLAGIGFDPDLKRAAFSASAVEEAPATPARMMPAFEAMAAENVPAVSSALTDFEIEAATASFQQARYGLVGDPESSASSSAASATALVEWWQPTPEPVEQIDAPELEFAGAVESPVVAAEAPATLHEAPSPAAAVIADHPAQTAETSAIEDHVQDLESRMQAFEALFNSDEAIPVEANPAALPDLLAQEELEAAQDDEAETVPPITLEDGAEERLPIAASAATATTNLAIADAADELQLDGESISNWPTTGKIPHEPQPPLAATPQQTNNELAGDPDLKSALENSPAQPAPAHDSFYSGISEDAEPPQPIDPAEDLLETPQTAAVEATSPMVCYLPKEEATEPARELSFYASLEPAATEFADAETLTPQSEAAQAEMQELKEGITAELAPPSVEELASGVLQQMTSELVQPEAETQQDPAEMATAEFVREQSHEEPDTVSSAASPGGEAKRIHQAVESVFDRFRPLLIAAIARELTKRN